MSTELQPHKRALCVEDHSDTYELIAYLLSECRVIVAPTKAEALRRAASEQFDLFLLDYTLPDVNGLEVCCFIRAFDKTTPIIFSTGSEDITEPMLATIGAQGIVKKGPDFIDALLAVAQRYLI